MKNIHIAFSLLCIIILNCFLFNHITRQREGFNPGKMIDRALGKLVDSILGSIKGLKEIAKKVKKKKGLVKKIKTAAFEMILLLLTIIFLPIAAIIALNLGFHTFTAMISNIPLLFKPTPLLEGV